MQDFSAAMNERQLAADEPEFYDRVVGNPIHAYKLMKRFAVDWKKLEQDLTDDDWKGNGLKWKSLEDQAPFKTRKDST